MCNADWIHKWSIRWKGVTENGRYCRGLIDSARQRHHRLEQECSRSLAFSVRCDLPGKKGFSVPRCPIRRRRSITRGLRPAELLTVIYKQPTEDGGGVSKMETGAGRSVASEAGVENYRMGMQVSDEASAATLRRDRRLEIFDVTTDP
jgi:hypothetical protein